MAEKVINPNLELAVYTINKLSANPEAVKKILD